MSAYVTQAFLQVCLIQVTMRVNVIARLSLGALSAWIVVVHLPTPRPFYAVCQLLATFSTGQVRSERLPQDDT